jgi:uracil phosphoribosyltransferase
MIHNLSQHNSIFNQFLTEIRDEEIQKDSMRFRRNLERMGEVFAYEISKTLRFHTVKTTTPLGEAEANVPADQPVIATILRAGLPLHLGLLNYFDQAHNAFVSAYRRHHKDNTFEIALEYVACPDLTGKTLILCDPMLATGSSMVLTYKALIQKGIPAHTHIVSAIACKQGIAHLKANMPNPNYTLWCGAIDEELTAHAFIVPGLGDAGDLAFGSKL